ncbi:MAG: Helix-turn-helix domain [Pseudomonadota bacterium]|jgi:excisionase family DNA binding protein
MSTAAPAIEKLLTTLDRFLECNQNEFKDMKAGAPLAAAARELGAFFAAPQVATVPMQTPTRIDDPLLTIPQTIAMLGVSKSWLYKMKKANRINFVKLGGMSRIRASTVARLLEFGTATSPP